MAADGDLRSLLPASNVVGTIRARHPTLYVFTGGNEDAAFLSIYGFNLLFDGGDQKEIAYWNFIKNYDKVNVVLSTRPSPECVRGISTMLTRKAIEQCHPRIGAFIGNLPARAQCVGDHEAAKAIRGLYEGLQAEGIKPYDVSANAKMEPMTLYEVFGEGSLRMTVLNPERNSKDLATLGNAMKTGENIERLSISASIAVVLIWQPSDHSKPTIRILYPGSCPLEKLYVSLEKLKSEECLRHVEYVNADREKYSSNLSLNTRGLHGVAQRSVGSQKTGDAIRFGIKPNTSVARTAASAKSPVSPATKITTKALHSEPKTADHAGLSPGAGLKKPMHSPSATGAAPRSAGSRLASKTTPAANRTSAVMKKETVGSKMTSAKPPAMPRKTPGHVEEKKKNEKKETRNQPDASIAVGATVSGEERKHDKKAAPTATAGKAEEFTATPQVPDKNGLLDGLEEPVKLKMISMDTDKDATNAVKPLEAAVVEENIPPMKSNNQLENELNAELGCDVSAAVSAGLFNLISSENKAEMKQPSVDGASQQPYYQIDGNHIDDNLIDIADIKTDENFGCVGHIEPGNAAATTQPDVTVIKSDLDQVIQSLVTESKAYDNSKAETFPAAGDDGADIKHSAKQNGNDVELLKAQQAMEDAHAREQHLPPVGTRPRTAARRTIGAVAKPKLSQPLYFDVVFVPHHGTHLALQDEAAAKAFAISVRSKRYVISGKDATITHILDGFIAAKNVWNKPELEIDVLPTHSSDSLNTYNQAKTGEMSEAGVNLRCAVDRCTVRLSSGGETDDCCAAFKFEL